MWHTYAENYTFFYVNVRYLENSVTCAKKSICPWYQTHHYTLLALRKQNFIFHFENSYYILWRTYTIRVTDVQVWFSSVCVPIHHPKLLWYINLAYLHSKVFHLIVFWSCKFLICGALHQYFIIIAILNFYTCPSFIITLQHLNYCATVDRTKTIHGVLLLWEDWWFTLCHLLHRESCRLF